ncbi:MAG: ABC transporter ATP-binding protein [Alphaproteobacteria bacterium]|nr:ABC transporter ATP-binding protein [Alphaproteobacteria bacterium]
MTIESPPLTPRASFIAALKRRLPLRDLGRVMQFFFNRYPYASATVIGSLLIANILEGIGILTLLPLLNIATGQSGAGNHIVTTFTGFLTSIGLSPSLGGLLVFMVLTVLLKSALTWLGMKYVGYTMARVQTDLRRDFIHSMLTARWSYFTSHPPGQLANTIGNEPERAANAIFYGVTLLVTLIQVIVYVGAAFLVLPLVALAAITTGLIMSVALSWGTRMARSGGAAQTESLKLLLSRFIDALQGIKAIKAMAFEKRFLPLLEQETSGLNRALERQVVANTAVRALQEPIATIAMAAGLYVTLTFFNIPLVEVMVLALLFWRAVQAIGGVQKIAQSMVAGESALWSLLDATGRAKAATEQTKGQNPPRLKTAITLAGVTFAHGDRPILTNLSLSIPANRITAIVGPSGTGKTTIADLVIGLYRPQHGTICIDDVSLGDIDLHAWREMIGYVPQETTLFAGSILLNVTLGDSNLGAEEAEVALRAAGAWDFVSSLPDGIHTVAGDRAQHLSGGQRQRIAIARALVRQPRLLVLDEATTALDPATEDEICQTLRQLSQEITILAISHQTAIVRSAHQVYELENGRARLQTVGVLA